jgi:DNA-binding CsgD family transcriptional regulator
MRHAILALNLFAFVSGAGALAFLFAICRDRSLRAWLDVSGALGCLIFIAACNCVDFYLKAFVGIDDWRLSFLTLNLLTLAAVLSLAILLRFVGAVSALSYPAVARAAFGLWSFAAYLASLSAALFAPNRAAGLGLGFLISALNCALCILVAALIVLARRDRIAPSDRRFAVRVSLFFIVWLVFDVGSEVGLWHELFGAPHIAMSPFFLVFLSALTVYRASRPSSPAASILSGASSLPGAVAAPSRWSLSEREAEVFALLVTGLENAEISDRLFISPHTVKNHITNIYRKAGARNRLELVGILRAFQ